MGEGKGEGSVPVAFRIAKSASINSVLLAAYTNLALQISALEYSGKDSEKKQVWAMGR